jgi:hypothetical protein
VFVLDLSYYDKVQFTTGLAVFVLLSYWTGHGPGN